jgi:hypothetical protein
MPVICTQMQELLERAKTPREMALALMEIYEE